MFASTFKAINLLEKNLFLRFKRIFYYFFFRHSIHFQKLNFVLRIDISSHIVKFIRKRLAFESFIRRSFSFKILFMFLILFFCLLIFFSRVLWISTKIEYANKRWIVDSSMFINKRYNESFATSFWTQAEYILINHAIKNLSYCCWRP
jgi:hypothetical protein